MDVSTGRLEELLEWLQTEAAFYWQNNWDETAARYGAWDNPPDREHLWDLKYKAETLDQFAFQIEDVLSEGKSGIRLEEISELLQNFAENEGEKELKGRMMYYFTADEHYGHANIIKYCHRPWDTVEEMDAALIELHNSVVRNEDTVVHAGDFCFGKKEAKAYLDRLNGRHIILRGSHDYWLKDGPEIWEKKIGDQYIVACHYAMRVWPRSHFNSWQV